MRGPHSTRVDEVIRDTRERMTRLAKSSNIEHELQAMLIAIATKIRLNDPEYRLRSYSLVGAKAEKQKNFDSLMWFYTRDREQLCMTRDRFFFRVTACFQPYSANEVAPMTPAQVRRYLQLEELESVFRQHLYSHHLHSVEYGLEQQALLFAALDYLLQAGYQLVHAGCSSASLSPARPSDRLFRMVFQAKHGVYRRLQLEWDHAVLERDLAFHLMRD